MSAVPEERVDQLAREFHAVYQAEAKRQGDVRHHDDYDSLPENIKEFDRALARHVVDALDQSKRELAALIVALRSEHPGHGTFRVARIPDRCTTCKLLSDYEAVRESA